LTRLPIVSGRQVVKALQKIDYEVDHQTGSHIILRCSFPPHRRVTVPDHREISPGTLRSILRSVGLTTDEFREIL